ncbi:hypothetical protein EON83_27100 [bacterium]|nr:MAG: hypothetical protein EON83_27100 [bacterium]
MALAIPIPDEKRAAIAAALLSGSGIRAVSREFGVSVSTVSKIKNELDLGVFEEARTEIKEREQHEQKVEQLVGLEVLIGGFLSQTFKSMSAQIEATARPDYVARQRADEMANLIKVEADVAIRILEAAAAAQKIEPPK